MTFRGAVVAFGVFFGVGASILSVVVIASIIVGEYRTAIQCAGMAMLFMVYALASRKFGSNDISPAVEFDGDGSTFKPDRGLDIPWHLAIVSVAACWACSLLPGSQDIWLLVLPGIAIVVGIGILVFLPFLRWGASAYLRMTPDGIEMGQRLRVTSYQWDQVRAVTDDTLGGWASATRTAVNVATDTDAFRLSAESFTPEGSALRELVEFYWLHPHERDELTDGRAQLRLEEIVEPLLRHWRDGT